jgi:outer membrane protein OmpA-like peptidoglycan-associated protein
MSSNEASNTGDRSRFSSVIGGILIGLGFICVGVIGYLFYQQQQNTEEYLARIQSGLNDLSVDTRQLADETRKVRALALKAEKSAKEAQQARYQAEADREVSEIHAELAREEARKAREELDRLMEEREKELQRLQQALGKIADTRRTALGLVMNLGNDTVEFDFDKATLRPENRELLSRIAGILLTATGYRLQIYGHTDDVGSDEYNQNLSERRALTVRDYFVEAGIDPSIITTKGLGKSNPLVPGNSPQARAKNRRVEIGIIDTLVNYEAVIRERESN